MWVEPRFRKQKEGEYLSILGSIWTAEGLTPRRPAGLCGVGQEQGLGII